MIPRKDLEACFKNAGLALVAKDADILCKVLKSNHENKHSYADFLIILLGDYQATQVLK
jgi:hypothetical protein